MLSVFLVVAIVEMTHSLYIKKNTIFNIKSEHLAKGEPQYDKSVTDFFSFVVWMIFWFVYMYQCVCTDCLIKMT